MSRDTDEIISIPESPARTTSPTTSASPVSPSSDSQSSIELLDWRDQKNLAKTHKKLKERFRNCRDKTLESELCRTINKFLNNCMSDDQYRRVIAIAIIILAIIGFTHILASIFWLEWNLLSRSYEQIYICICIYRYIIHFILLLWNKL